MAATSAAPVNPYARTAAGQSVDRGTVCDGRHPNLLHGYLARRAARRRAQGGPLSPPATAAMMTWGQRGADGSVPACRTKFGRVRASFSTTGRLLIKTPSTAMITAPMLAATRKQIAGIVQRHLCGVCPSSQTYRDALSMQPIQKTSFEGAPVEIANTLNRPI